MNITTIDPNELPDEHISQLEKAAGLIEPLCEGELGATRLRELRTQACLELGIGERALRDWVRRFKSGGLLALLRKKRKDAGTLRRFDPALVPKATQLLQENPARSIVRILEFLRKDPVFAPSAEQISASCLYQRMREAGVDFRELRAALPKRPFLTFAADFPNQLWQGDARHGIPIPHPADPKKTKMTYLFAWIDDYSRLILHAQYYYDEKLPHLEDCFRQAVLKHGLPDRVYVDNGAAYKAHQFMFLLNENQVRKIHHPPYRAWCKGKAEALMKALLKFQYEAILAGMMNLDELNTALSAWVDVEHNRKIHSQTGQTPITRFLEGIEKRPPRRVTNLERFNNSFLWVAKRVVDPTGKISFHNNIYHATEIPPGTPLSLRYDPFDLTYLYLFSNGTRTRTFKAHILARTQAPSIPEEKKDPPQKVSRASAEYFTRLREQHLKNIARTITQRTFSNLKDKEQPK